jgi:hypothetical protein
LIGSKYSKVIFAIRDQNDGKRIDQDKLTKSRISETQLKNMKIRYDRSFQDLRRINELDFGRQDKGQESDDQLEVLSEIRNILIAC